VDDPDPDELNVRVVCLLLALAGCGRFSFDASDDDGGITDTTDSSGDARPCTAAGHDEDADRIDDVCDLCPHVPDPAQLDGDGDFVGDACDPEPTVPRQQLVMFDPFVTLDTQRWTFVHDEHVTNDELILDAVGVGREISRPYTRAQDWFVIGATAGAAGSGTNLIALIADQTGGDQYYCEIFDDGVKATTMFTYTTNLTMFTHDGVAPWTTQLASGGGNFELLLTATTARCRSSWRGDVKLVEGMRPTAITADRFMLYAENVSLHVQWLVQIRTNP
jgi:hypothetical protein